MSYESRILSLSPVLYLPFTETSGTTFADSTGNGHNGTVINSVTAGGGDSFISGEKACLLNDRGFGESINIEIASPSTIPISDHAFSYEFWKTNQFLSTAISLGNNTDNIFGGAVVPPTEGFQFYGSDLTLKIFAHTNNSSIPAYGLEYLTGDFNTLVFSDINSSEETDNPSCFHYFCVTFDGVSNIDLYKDGILFGSGSVTPLSFTPVYCILGQFGTLSSLLPHSSLINHLAVYDYTLTPTQVLDNYHASFPRQDGACFGGIFPNPPPPPVPDIAILATVFRNRIDIHQKTVELT